MTEQQKHSKTMNIILWMAQVILAAFFMMGAVMKFMPIEKISSMMPWTGQLAPFIVRLLGLIDLLGAIGLILPSLIKIKPQLTSWAAIGIILMMISAIIFHVSRGEGSVIGMNLFCSVLAGFVAWGRFEKG
ncbi:DoxX family protein [Dyadobacter sp. 3J3]|uniref:DoxX family protein n=1 Tax=Dyadobacter sp. 3J3 TaxID=2606600 RepID=UPI00135A7BE9|nr:DoxX family protein [Dyadobacter sp. 3J3]